MKKPNIELNTLKLEQKRIQLSTITQQYTDLAHKLSQVKGRLDAKQLEVTQLESYINEALSKPVAN